jgi:hypothetical protein
MLERHYLLTLKSKGIEASIKVVWNPVDSVTTQQKAELNDKKADTDQKYINMGSVSPDEVRQRLRDDNQSGYNRLSDDEANTEAGMSPENIAALEKGEGEEEPGEGDLDKGAADIPVAQPSAENPPVQKGFKKAANEDDAPSDNRTAQLHAILTSLKSISDLLVPEGRHINDKDQTPGINRSVKPSVGGATGTTAGIGSVVPTTDAESLPVVKMSGLVMPIENARGTFRVGKNGDWKQKMPHDYGFIKGTKGADDDEIDCFIGKNLQSKDAYIVNQNKKDGSFDEHKVMLGFNSASQAKQGYKDSYAKGWSGFGSMHKMSMDEFKEWLKGDTTKPVGLN